MNRSTLILFALTILWAAVQALLVFALWVSVGPDAMTLAGSLFVGFILLIGIAAGLSLFTHAIRNLRARRGSATEVMLSARTFEDEDTTTYEVTISAGSRRWRSPAYGGRGIRSLLENGRMAGLAWFDPKSGLPTSAEVNGQAITTYPTVREVPGE